MFWIVRIDCWSQAKHGAKSKRVQRAFLVEGNSSDEVQRVGLEQAEKTAAFGPLWVKFEWRESSTTKLPLELPT